MYRKPAFSVIILLLALAGAASAYVVPSGETHNWYSRTRIPDGYMEVYGTAHFYARVDFDAGDTLIVYDGGKVYTYDTTKFPDSTGQQNVLAFIYGGGLWDAYDIENRAYERGGHIGLYGCGTLIVRTHYNTGDREYDPLKWVQDDTLRCEEPEGELEFTDLGGGAVEIHCVVPTKVEFDSPDSNGPESESAVSLIVKLSEPVEETVTVDYEVTGGTAEGNGVDYNLPLGTLTFDPCDTSEQITIDIVNDGNDEQDETIVVTLTGVSGGDAVLGEITQHTYTIVDPRPNVEFATSASIGNEDAGSAEVVVVLSHTCSETVTVDYAVTGGSATRDQDYALADGTLTFDPCEISKNINVTLINDPCEEGPETIELTLSEPNNAKLGNVNQHIFTIDDDELPSTFTNSLGMEFVLVQPGTFTMGSGDGHRIEDGSDGDYDEQPAHQVTLTESFYILKTKVSQTYYQQSGLPDSASDVSWNDANSFAEWLSAEDGNNYNLPTEAQWQYVYENPGGVQDMAGREWVWDWHGLYPFDNVTDPVGPVKGVLKIIRGDGQNRWSLPTNATYQPWQLGEAQACTFRLVMEFGPPETPHISPGPFCQAAVKQSTAPALEGPDPDVPYFTVRFALPIPPDNSEDGLSSLLGCDPATVHHNHSPGFEILPNGDALAVYFSAPGSEYGSDVRFVQARLRFGSDQWDMPELFWDMKGMNDESPLLWTESDGTIHLFGGGRIDGKQNRPFVMATSSDNGATWILKRPYFPVPAVNFEAQPVTNAWRGNSNTIYMVTDGDGTNSLVWKSSDNGITWYDTGGRTGGRHSTIVPLLNGNWLALGGKNSYIDDYNMPQWISTDQGQSWGSESATPFSWLGSNQRPNVIRLANGKLAFCSDAQHRDGSRPSAATYGRGAVVAISDDDGVNWDIKNLPVTLPHESDLDDGTLGYSTIRQAPDGVIHILSTMTHPCLHYELNEAWINSDACDIPPETTGGTVNDYNEHYPGGALKATWSARICPHGRYLLDGTDTSYYETGQKEHEAHYTSGRKTGEETFWAQDGTKIWSWQHDDANNTSVWTHYWSNGLKRIESRWDTYPQARDLVRNFSGFVADGNAYQWGRCGQPTRAYKFVNSTYAGETTLAEPQSNITADLTGDCSVDYKDLDLLLDEWLKTGYTVYPNVPDGNELLLHYKLDEASGDTVNDSSGYNNTATRYNMDDTDWISGKFGNALDFDGINDYVYNSNLAVSPSGDITLSCWISTTVANDANRAIDLNGFQVRFGDNGKVGWDNGGGPTHETFSTEAVDDGDWHSVIFVRTGTNYQMYIDGQPDSTDSGSAPGYDWIYLGRKDGGNYYDGKLDDVRIYDYALSHAEILYLADTSSIWVPLDSIANLYDDDKINFKDVAVLASQWLQSYP